MMNTHFKMYTNGLMLILIGWGLKHILVSAALFGGGQAIEGAALQSDMNAEVWDETFEDEIRIAEIRAEISELERDIEDDKGDKFAKYEKIEEKNKKIRDIREGMEKVERKIRDKYITKRVEAQYSSVKGQSKAVGLAKWTLKLKILLDLAKIAGVFMIVLASVRIIRTEPDASDTAVGPTKNLAIASIILVLFGTFVQGVVSFLS